MTSKFSFFSNINTKPVIYIFIKYCSFHSHCFILIWHQMHRTILHKIWSAFYNRSIRSRMVSLLINDFQSICFVGNKVGWTDGRKTSVGYSYFCGVVLERKPSWTLSAHDLATETSCESTSIVPTATPYIFFAKLLILWIEIQLKAKCTKKAKKLQIVISSHEIIVIRYICVIFECP